MALSCPGCGCLCDDAATNCVICGSALVAGATPVAPSVRSHDPEASKKRDYDHVRLPGTTGVRVPIGWVHLGIGIFIALVFTLTPTLRFMGWLVGSLFHETGHVAFGWYVGCPAFPAISLRGHAAAVHQAQSMGVVALIGLALVTANVLAWKVNRFKGLALSLLVAWPLFTFVEGIRELGFLLSGHMGELIFAGIFLWRARTGQAIEKEAERPIYAGLGWFLVARNVVLAFGLAFVPAVRAWYLSNGSFGLMNDYARVAFQVLHIPLEAVGIVMGIVSLAVFPIVLAMTWQPPTVAGRVRDDSAWQPKPMPKERSRV